MRPQLAGFLCASPALRRNPIDPSPACFECYRASALIPCGTGSGQSEMFTGIVRRPSDSCDLSVATSTESLPAKNRETPTDCLYEPVYKSKGEAFYRIQFRLNNQTYVKSAKTSGKRVAERMEAEWKAEIHARQYLGVREEVTVWQILENYLKAPLAPATLKHARVFINVLQRYISIDVNASAFDPRELHRYREARLKEG